MIAGHGGRVSANNPARLFRKTHPVVVFAVALYLGGRGSGAALKARREPASHATVFTKSAELFQHSMYRGIALVR